MSAIDGIGPPGSGRLSPRTRPPAAGGFRIDAAAASGVPTHGAEAAQAAVPACMLALQEVDNEAPRDRAARRHGRALLAALVRLQHRLLGGIEDDAALQEIAVLASNVPAAADVGLAAALHAVVLRARIELARLGH